MAFYDSYEFIEAFRNGGCFIFEGEEGNPDVTEEDPEDTSVEEVEEDPESTEETEAQTEEPSEETTEDEAPTPEVEKVNTAENVNSDTGTAQKQKMNADQIVKAFLAAKQLGPTMEYAKRCIGKPINDINLEMVEPYIRAAVEKFCDEKFQTTVDDIAAAINILVKSTGVKEVKKQKALAAKANKAKQQKEAQSGGEAPAEAPAEGGGEAPAEEAPPADEGGEEAER